MGVEVLGRCTQTSHTTLLPALFCFLTFLLGLLTLLTSKSFSLYDAEKLPPASIFTLGYLNPVRVLQHQGSMLNQGLTPERAKGVREVETPFSRTIVLILLTVLLVQQ